MAEFDKDGWRIWASDVSPISDKDLSETYKIMDECLPKIIERHEDEING